jgi:hypothetical protein
MYDPIVVSAEEVVNKSLLKYLENIGLTKVLLRLGQKAILFLTCNKLSGHAS